MLGICCPPFSEEQRATFEAQLALHFNGDTVKAKKVSDETFEDFAKFTKKLAEKLSKADDKA